MTVSEKKSQPITGKVAGILTLRELAINRGSADGVEIGMRFAVLNSQGIDIRDPDTGKVLGSTELVKTVVKIVRIDAEHLSVGRTFRTIPGRVGLAALSLSLGGTGPKPETLEIGDMSTLKEELAVEDSYVKIGDPVVQTEGDEYDTEL